MCVFVLTGQEFFDTRFLHRKCQAVETFHGNCICFDEGFIGKVAQFENGISG